MVAACNADFDWPERIKTSVSVSLVNRLCRNWVGRIAHYGLHRNDEHRLALFEEAVRYTGLHLENDLSGSEYWSAIPLDQRAGLLLFLVDRGIVDRSTRRGRRVFEPLPHAEAWVRRSFFVQALCQANTRAASGPPPRAEAARTFPAGLIDSATTAAVRSCPFFDATAEEIMRLRVCRRPPEYRRHPNSDAPPVAAVCGIRHRESDDIPPGWGAASDRKNQ